MNTLFDHALSGAIDYSDFRAIARTVLLMTAGYSKNDGFWEPIELEILSSLLHYEAGRSLSHDCKDQRKFK